MEDGDGITVPPHSGIVDNENSHVQDSEESELSKQTSMREHLFSSSDKNFTESNTLRSFVGFSNVNGDCMENNVGISERILTSSPTNSLSSMFSETTRDSIHDESSRHQEPDSGSENGSKSSSSEASVGQSNFNLSKSEDSHRLSSELSDSSSDSDSSESEDSFIDKDEGGNNETMLDDNTRLRASPSNNCQDFEKDLSSDREIDDEQKDMKSNEDTINSSDNEHLRIECPEAQNSTSLHSLVANYSNSEHIPESVVNDEYLDHLLSENEKGSCDNIVNVENTIFSTSNSVAETSEPTNHDKPSVDIIVDCSERSSEEVMEFECKNSVENNSEVEQQIIVDSTNVKQRTIDSNLKEDLAEKENEQVPRMRKRKTAERVNVSELGEQFSIQYKGFKKTRTVSGLSSDIKNLLKSNPFNPAWKQNHKNRFGLLRNCRDEIDCSTLQPEYAQYLGLQPIVKFKCSNCGMSTFQTMSALNTHQVECKKNGKLISHNSEISPLPNVNSANIKLTRKVFLCSTCGTYYENCDLFLHMREFHRRYICLFCLFMAQSPEVLQEHLKDKHNINNQTYMSLDELQKCSPQTFFLLCLRCDRVFTEMDDSVNHKCTNKNTNDVEHSFIKKPRIDNVSLQDPFDISNLSSSENPKSKTSPKMLKEVITNKSNNFSHITNELYFSEDENKDSPNDNFTEKSKKIEDEIMNDNTERLDVTLEAENLQLKVPSGIEIKPLVSGEKIHYERNEAGKSTIEIFPISTEPVKKKVKFIRKTKKIIKKTIKKKSSKTLKIQKVMDNVNNAISTQEAKELETSEVSKTPETLEQNPLSPSRIEGMQSVPHLPGSAICSDLPDTKRNVSQEIFKIKLPGEIASDGESDDSQKLSLVVDENTNNSDEELQENNDDQQNGSNSPKEDKNQSAENSIKVDSNEITLAREDVAAMALTLDDKTENVPIQAVVKECVRTSCLSCNYCRHACKIAVNGKQLALHLLSEHRYTPVKNETHDDVVRKLLSSLEVLQNMYFNTETYDSSDSSIHIPYDQEKNYDCFQCNYVSSSHKDLYAHKRKLHTKSLLLCIMCKSNFYSYSELICHICPGSYNAKVQFHNVDLIFRCCFCRLDTIPSAFRLMVHLRKSHHTCDICLEMCIDQQKLSTHMWKHKLNHLCYRCGIAYASKPDITKHLFWKHGTESVLCRKCLQKKWPHVYHFCIPPTSFICEECNISFSKAVALKVHKRIHGNDYPYSCEQCEKRFVSKKLLSRHLDRHNELTQRKEKLLNSPEEEKEEIINVTDINDVKECSQNENSEIHKEIDGKDKGHKKHKKEKEKKEKKVVDVYDLPPLNLSSESDSSDEEESCKTYPSTENKESNIVEPITSDVKLTPLVDDEHTNNPDMPNLDGNSEDNLANCLPIITDQLDSEISHDVTRQEKHDSDSGEMVKPSCTEPISSFVNITVNALLPLNKDHTHIDDVDLMQNDQVEGIWENFYKTNPQNSKLPFPLYAMKSEVAYSIIMGDHDYCQPVKTDPVIKDLPSASTLVASLLDDKLEEVTPIIPEKPPQTPPQKEQETSSTPTSMSKKKLKSPKKKMSKTPDDNNSSSSSDSSSDSDTSSCSCGTNCSCSSSSSNSSSSSSSDSDSSTNEDKTKQDKRKKRKDKKIKSKPESEVEPVKDTAQKEPEIELPVVPEDPPIRESELETDETTSDEEFYDRQPQIIANQMLAEKRQLVLLATGAPVNNGSASPTIAPPAQESIVSIPTEPIETPKQKTKPKRKRKIVVTPKLSKTEKSHSLSDPYPKFLNEPKSYSSFQQTIAPLKQKLLPSIPQSPSLSEAGGSGPESDTRLSKRRRVPNKFYGYSSGEEEDTPKQTPKWRKLESQMTPIQTPKIQPNLAPPTPRIQLTVPKQVIRKPIYHKANMKSKQHSTSESSDSAMSDVEERISHPAPEESIKADKDVYCYCQCPYDEVSEMIACDDENCKIEWFHFECVGILVPPRGQWFCPGCRKARGLPT